MQTSKIFTIRQSIQRLPSIPAEWFIDTLILPFCPIRPRVLIYNVTFRCNSRCMMCGNWQKKERELNIEEIRKTLRSPLFKKIENLGISGGEPTLREDLPEVLKIACETLPNLKKVNINTNGLSPKHVTNILTSSIAVCHSNGVMCSVRISIDGFEETHDRVRGITGSFKQAQDTLFRLKQYQKQRFFNLGILYTITKDTYKDIDKLWEWAINNNIDIVYNVVRISGPGLGNEAIKESLELDRTSKDSIINSLRKLIRLKGVLSPDSYIYYHFATMLQNNYNRIIPCPFLSQGMMLNPNGNLFYCENSPCIGNVLEREPEEIYFDRNNMSIRNTFAYTICKHCISPCQANISAIKQILPYLLFIIRSKSL